MCLTEADSKKNIIIKEIISGMRAKRKLSSMGLHINDLLIKLNDSGQGPVLIENVSNGNYKLALGRGLAEKIIVEYED